MENAQKLYELTFWEEMDNIYIFNDHNDIETDL